MTDDIFRDWDAAYVLGSLAAEDRRAYERHLGTCPACSAAVGELAGLPGILGKIGRDEAVAMLDPGSDGAAVARRQPDVVGRLAASTRRRRRRTRIAALATSFGIAALLAAGGFFAGTALMPPATVATEALAMQAVTPGVMTASLHVTEKAWGTRFDWTCSYTTDKWGPGGRPATYAMVVTDDSGVETTVATWDATGGGDATLVASSSVPTSAIASVEIRWLDGPALVRSEL